jgi:hypothetical protein
MKYFLLIAEHFGNVNDVEYVSSFVNVAGPTQNFISVGTSVEGKHNVTMWSTNGRCSHGETANFQL